jgi:hypothetical protein
LGRQQFFDNQTTGKVPEISDKYYELLIEGKSKFDLLCREYHQLYVKKEWWGFYQLWKDWEGHRWLLPFLCKWYKTETDRELPIWLTKDEEPLDF